jgi:hypothetical protein
MKHIQFLAAVGLILAFGSVVRAETAAKPAAITVVGVQGEARYSVDGKEWHPLVVGKILREGSVIETAAGSSCDLVLSGKPVPVPQSLPVPQGLPAISLAPDPNVVGYTSYKPMAEQNVIRMQGGTMLAVDKLTQIDTGVDAVGDTELDLRAGSVFLNVKKMSADSQFIVKLPNGVAGIRGSWGTLSADGSAHCGAGSFVLSLIVNGQAHVIVVKGGFGFDPQTGQVYILGPGVLQALRALSNQTTTLVVQVVSLTRDVSAIFISPNQGAQVASSSPPAGPPPEE